MYLDEKKSGERILEYTDLERTDLERFIAWAQTRDPQETYYYFDPNDCLIARWDRSEGRQIERLASGVDALFGGNGRNIVQYDIAGGLKRTIGRALQIALKIQSRKSVA